MTVYMLYLMFLSEEHAHTHTQNVIADFLIGSFSQAVVYNFTFLCEGKKSLKKNSIQTHSGLSVHFR